MRDKELEKEVQAADIRVRLDRDKAYAKEVIDTAKHELSSFRSMTIIPDITGRPKDAAQLNQFNRDQYRNLENVTRCPFFAHVSTDLTLQGETEKKEVFITTARDLAGLVEGDTWVLVSWTSPLAMLLREKKPGESASFTARNRSTASYQVGNSSKYEELLPRFSNGEFAFPAGSRAIASEDDLDTMVVATAPVPKELPAIEYTAKPTFGLDDIIRLVDQPQQASMALPFRESVIIEGPPGSGKTSVGLMRIAVLHDQQWDILGLDRDRDHPYHDESTTRILVYNQEMVEYLKGLAQNIQIKNVVVDTTAKFLTRICRATGLLSGVQRGDKQRLMVIKGRREALHAYLAAWKSHLRRTWPALEPQLRQELTPLGPDFLVFVDRLKDWEKQVQASRIVDDRIEGSVNLAELLTDTADAVRRAQSPTRPQPTPAQPSPSVLPEAALQQRLVQARDMVSQIVRAACNRVSLTREMFELPEYVALMEAMRQNGVSEKVLKDGDRLWRRQYAGELPSYSELDLAMTAWLGARILLWNRNGRPWIGGKLEKLTHIVVDEAQDLSPGHIAVLVSQLDRDGTMTLVGDLHQNLNPRAGLRSWEDAHLAHARRMVFGVNHRQTFQLGTFLQQLHTGLFGGACQWRASRKIEGRIARAGVARSWSALANSVAAEVRYWRGAIEGANGATVAIIYDGKIEQRRLRILRSKLEKALGDLLIKVELAPPRTGGESLRRTDQVTIASVRQTKGLEFDAVIFIETAPRWSKPATEVDIRIKNGLYVATSRARAGLSLCMSNLPSCVPDIVAKGDCEMVKWEVESDDEKGPK